MSAVRLHFYQPDLGALAVSQQYRLGQYSQLTPKDTFPVGCRWECSLVERYPLDVTPAACSYGVTHHLGLRGIVATIVPNHLVVHTVGVL